MKGKTILLIAGGAIITGAVAYGIYRYLHDSETASESDSKMSDDETQFFNAAEIFHSEAVVTKFEQAQQDTVESIRENHKEAAQQLEDTLNEMATDCAEFETKISQANADLDELLK